MPMLLALAAAVATPQPGELKTFRDWIVGCDNGRACQAVALVPEAEDGDGYLMLVVTRSPEAQAQAELSWSITGSPPRSSTLTVDGKRVAQTRTTTIAIDAPLAAALAAGATAEVVAEPGGKASDASLGGLAAALRYMDDRQKRVGTATALVARGPGKAVPPPALPVIARPPVPAKPPRTIGPARAATLIGPDAATCDYASGKVDPQAFRLDATRSLVLVQHPCGNGAYNMFASAFIVDEGGKVSPARYDTDVANPRDGENLGLVNSDYDPKTRLLSSFMKGRGLGDCGGGQDYAWDGTRFRLIKAIAMGECRGSVDYITTWRATVR